MAEMSSLVVVNKLLRLPDCSELVTTPLISIQTLLLENSNLSVNETADNMSILVTESTSNSLIELVAVTHIHGDKIPAKSELVVPLITLCKEQN